MHVSLTLISSLLLLLLLMVSGRSVIVSQSIVSIEHVAKAAAESLRHDAVEQRIDAAAQVVTDTWRKEVR